MSYIVQTQRLGLREFTLADTKFVIELVNSPGWLEFIGDKNIRTEDDAKSYLENGPLASYGKFGYGLSMVELLAGKKPVGMCGIINRDNLDTPDIGFAFLPEFEGLGFGFEIAKAVLDHAKIQLGLQSVSAITDPRNKKSIRLLEKLGLSFAKRFSVEGSDEELLLFRN